MASSSVSQESLDMDDFDTSARRNRIRVHRGHSARGVVPFRGLPDRGVSAQPDHDEGAAPTSGSRDLNGDSGDGILPCAGGLALSSHYPADHESPTRSAAARLKDKQRGRPNHMKGKLPKDKRKLREKRRSTGVVHCMPSTESTGDSLDDDDDDELVVHDTKKNTMYNEGSGASHHHQSLYEARPNTTYSHPRRNKSPSDLEADLEDNQDYDSTVSHSETNLSLIGRSESAEMPPSLPAPTARPVSHHHIHQLGEKVGGPSATHQQRAGVPGSHTGRAAGFTSKYSPETSRARKFNAVSSTSAKSGTNNGSSDAPLTSSSSVLSRWRDYPDSSSLASALPARSQGVTLQRSPDSPRRLNSGAGSSTLTSTATSTLSDREQVVSSQPASTISSSGSSSSTGGQGSRPLGFSVFSEEGRSGVTTTSAFSSNGTSSNSAASNSKPATSGSVGGYLSGAFSRTRDRDSNPGSSSLHQRMANYQSPRPYGAPSQGLAASAATQHSSREELSHLEKQLERERDQNQQLKQQLDDRDKKIAELEKAIELLNSECDGLDEDNIKLQEENKALIRAMSKLTSNV